LAGCSEYANLSIIACGVYIGIVGGANIWNIRHQASETLAATSSGATSVGPGLWVLLLGSILAMVGATLSPSASHLSDFPAFRQQVAQLTILEHRALQQDSS
jgi:hypothetical protein